MNVLVWVCDYLVDKVINIVINFLLIFMFGVENWKYWFLVLD